MVAGLLYFIGLVAVLVTVAICGYQAPSAITDFNAATERGTDVIGALAIISRDFAWTVVPLVGGLALMGFGRMIILLTAINRNLRT
jgi:hypothetical protein